MGTFFVQKVAKNDNQINNPDFNYTDFGTIKNTAGSINFVLSVKQ
jgi:hypothetical protein